MFESLKRIFKRDNKDDEKLSKSKEAAKERLHLVLMQDRANVSVDFLELMKQEIIDVIKKYIEVDDSAIDVRLTNKENGDGTNGAPALYANIPIINIKNDVKNQILENQEKKESSEKKEKEEVTKKQEQEKEAEDVKEEKEVKKKEESPKKEKKTEEKSEKINSGKKSE